MFTGIFLISKKVSDWFNFPFLLFLLAVSDSSDGNLAASTTGILTSSEIGWWPLFNQLHLTVFESMKTSAFLNTNKVCISWSCWCPWTSTPSGTSQYPCFSVVLEARMFFFQAHQYLFTHLAPKIVSLPAFHVSVRQWRSLISSTKWHCIGILIRLRQRLPLKFPRRKWTPFIFAPIAKFSIH